MRRETIPAVYTSQPISYLRTHPSFRKDSPEITGGKKKTHISGVTRFLLLRAVSVMVSWEASTVLVSFGVYR
jgi:hypothetical protein